MMSFLVPKSYHGANALVYLCNSLGSTQLADDLKGEFHRAASGKAGDELAVDDDSPAVLDMSGWKSGVHGRMTDDLLLRSQPAVGEQGGGRGAYGGDPLTAFALTREPVAHKRAFGQALRTFRAAGQHDDFKFARGFDILQTDVGKMFGVARGDDRVGRKARNKSVDSGAAQNVDDGDTFDVLEAGGKKNQRAHAVRGERFGSTLGNDAETEETETVATAARIRLRRAANSSVRTT